MTSSAEPIQVKKALKQIEGILRERVPELVAAHPCEGSAYAVLLCYFNLTTDEFTPVVIVAPDTLRQKHREAIIDEFGEPAWSPHQQLDYENHDLTLDDPALSRLCNEVYETLSRDWKGKKEEAVILPFRRMMYRVARSLNGLDWSDRLPVTEDFVVAAVDYSGFWVSKDVARSVGPMQRRQLKKGGWLFSLTAAAWRILSGLSRGSELDREVARLEAMWADERATALIDLLAREDAGQPLGPFRENPFKIKQMLNSCDQSAVLPALRFIEARVGDSDIPCPNPDRRWNLLGAVSAVIPRGVETSPEAEQLLRSIARQTLPDCDGSRNASPFNFAALNLHESFDGYPEPEIHDSMQPASNAAAFVGE